MSTRMNTEAHIVQFLLVQTGEYQEQTLRPYHTTVSGGVEDQLREATRGGRSLGVRAFQDVAGSVLHHSPHVEGVANIAHGWRSRRFRFMMKVIEKSQFTPNAYVQRVFFGYTDQCDVSYGNRIDPDMRIYFNSETIVLTDTVPTMHGPVTQSRILGSNQIISPADMSGAAGVPGASHYLLRPEDVFSTGIASNMTAHMQEAGQFSGPVDDVYLLSGTVGQKGNYRYSSRSHASPERFLSRSFKAYYHSLEEQRGDQDVGYGGGGVDRELLFNEALEHASDQDFTDNDFFSRLRDYGGFMEYGYVTFGRLMNVFPEVERPDVTETSMDDGSSIRRVYSANDSEGWTGADTHTIAASTLGQVVPAAMMDNFIRHISFAVTNGMQFGEYNIEIHYDTLRMVVDHMGKNDVIDRLEEFKRRVMVDALDSLTKHNQMSFSISMESSLAGDSVIDVRIDNRQLERFVAPTFADSLFPPVLTCDKGRQSLIGQDLTYLMDQVFEGAESHTNVTLDTRITPTNYQMGRQDTYAASPQTPPQQGNFDDDITSVL